MQPLSFLITLVLLFWLARALLRALKRWRVKRKWARAPQRDVSALAQEGEAGFKQEVIRTGGTLKPQHRRLVLRDNRLLPKPPLNPKRRRWPLPAKVKYLSEQEADRLFGPSLRTRNRDIMDLAIDA